MGLDNLIAKDRMKNHPFNKHREQKKIVRSYAFYNLGIFLGWSSFVALFNLQSSINIEDGLGTTSLAVAFVVEIICATFFTPVMIKRYGAKIWLVIGDLGMVPYIIANIYPSYFTLLPASILLAVLQSSLWPSMCLVNVLYATLYSNVSKRPKDVHTILFSGYFFTAFQASQVFGGLLAYVVLYGFDQIPVPSVGSDEECNSLNSTNLSNATKCISNQTLYKFCGIHDCQDADVINQSIDHYQPVNKVSLYVLIGICFALAVAATLVHGFLIPNDKTIEKKQKYYKSEMAILQRENGDQSAGDKDAQTESALYAPSKDDSFIRQCVDVAKAVWRHISTLKLLLLLPITFYNGLTMAFIATEATRAYTSCILGVQWVGICMALYGLFDAIFSWIVGKFGRRLGRITLFTIALVFDIGNYLYLLFWSPTEYLLFSVLIMFITFGSTDGIFQTIINVTHIDFFPINEDLAVLIWNTVVLSGFAVGYALSPILCVNTRVYLNFGILIFGFICVIIAEFYHRKDKPREIKVVDDSQQSQPSQNDSSAILS